MLANTGHANVMVTNGRGITPEEYAHMAVAKIISIGPEAHPTIRVQAEAYSKQIEAVIVRYMQLAVRSDRTTIYNALVEAGHPDLAKSITEL